MSCCNFRNCCHSQVSSKCLNWIDGNAVKWEAGCRVLHFASFYCIRSIYGFMNGDKAERVELCTGQAPIDTSAFKLTFCIFF